MNYATADIKELLTQLKTDADLVGFKILKWSTGKGITEVQNAQLIAT